MTTTQKDSRIVRINQRFAVVRSFVFGTPYRWHVKTVDQIPPHVLATYDNEASAIAHWEDVSADVK